MTLKTAALVLLSLTSLSSIAQFRKYSNEFLNIGAGARGLAMGSAQVASVQDGTAGYWNPAGLTAVENHPQANLMHAEYFAGIGKYDYVSLALPTTGNKRTIGISALRFAVDDIMNTLFLVEPDGTVNYNNIQSFSSADYAFIVSLAQKLKESSNKNINFGINAKVIHRSVGSFAKAWGFGLDAGLQIKTGNWHLGVAARDITTTFNSWSFSFTEKEKEANFQRALSDGDTLNQKKVWIYQPSAGAGFRLQNVRIDYAFTNLANQSNPLYTHVFSLQFDLVNDKSKKKK
ncbi:MAG: hypothetical protein EON98_12910 [Chitinophagaceae bacterium]|nr:MAG: hypothetical protein EON98_12910 [Chitinophagaceae bacterium]